MSRLQRLVGGRGIDAVRIESLIEHGPQEQRPVVQEDPVPADLDLAHAEISADPCPRRPSPSRRRSRSRRDWAGRRPRASAFLMGTMNVDDPGGRSGTSPAMSCRPLLADEQTDDPVFRGAVQKTVTSAEPLSMSVRTLYVSMNVGATGSSQTVCQSRSSVGRHRRRNRSARLLSRSAGVPTAVVPGPDDQRCSPPGLRRSVMSSAERRVTALMSAGSAPLTQTVVA